MATEKKIFGMSERVGRTVTAGVAGAAAGGMIESMLAHSVTGSALLDIALFVGMLAGYTYFANGTEHDRALDKAGPVQS